MVSAFAFGPPVGKSFDETGERLTPSHEVKGSRRYRYDVSRSLMKGAAGQPALGWRIPAHKLRLPSPGFSMTALRSCAIWTAILMPRRSTRSLRPQRSGAPVFARKKSAAHPSGSSKSRRSPRSSKLRIHAARSRSGSQVVRLEEVPVQRWTLRRPAQLCCPRSVKFHKSG
jgi:hypothetical protein